METTKTKKALAIACLVCGIISVLGGGVWRMLVFSIAGIVLARMSRDYPSKIRKAGSTLSVIGLVLAVVRILIYVFIYGPALWF